MSGLWPLAPDLDEAEEGGGVNPLAFVALTAFGLFLLLYIVEQAVWILNSLGAAL